MPKDRLRRIEVLPHLVEECVQTAGTTRELFFRRAVKQLLRPDSTVPALNWLRSVSFAWRFYLARQANRVVFFFGRKRGQIEVVLDANLRFEVQPVMTPLVESPRLSAALAARLLWPTFLDPKPPAPDQVHFRLGTAEAPERLIVRQPERGPRSTASARRGQVQYSRSGNDLPVVEGDGRWRLEPFLAWIEGLRRWMKDPRATSSWEPLELVPSLQNRAARVILDTVLSTFQRAVHATEPPAGLLPAAPDDGPSVKAELTEQDPYRLLPCRQRLAGFSGSVLLRLGSNGELAEKHDDDPLTLELHYRLSQRDDQTELELEIRPPDLLIGGELHREFLRAFEETAVEARAHLRLGLNDEAALRAFFRNGTAEAVVMRIRRRKDTDDDLLVLPGDIAGIRLVTVFQAEVEVTRDPSRPDRHRVRLTSRLRLLQPRSQAEDPEELPDRVVERFFRLMAALKNWGGLWP